MGTKVALSTATDNATIMYSVNGAEYAEYNAAEKIAIDTFPATIRTYARAEGLKDSITTTYTYTQEKAEIPTVIPNGGSVRETDKIKFKSSTEGAKIFYAYADANAVIEETSNTEDAETAEAEEPETEETSDWNIAVIKLLHYLLEFLDVFFFTWVYFITNFIMYLHLHS